MSELNYLSGFGNHFSTEAEPGALPIGQNSPQKPPLGLYAEQFSGSPFTVPRAEMKRTWFYRIRPSVAHSKFEIWADGNQKHFDPDDSLISPNQYRWDPLPYPEESRDFLESLHIYLGNGHPSSQSGGRVGLYAANRSMDSRFFSNSDAEMLIVPQDGVLRIESEFGKTIVSPLEIALIPRGTKFRVQLTGKQARGYICENFGVHFRIPDLGPIGSNGLANPRDFQTPVASYSEERGNFELVTQINGKKWIASIEHNPCDVVAWHGNYTVSKYDLRLFNTIGTVSYDHPDPSIFTVLTSPTNQPGKANFDFAIFPPRWMVAENTFRPPWYHRNLMSEFMGLITGVYDAKEGGFAPGGASLHNMMSAHGPDKEAHSKASQADLKPEKYESTMAFMFESSLPFAPTEWALKTPLNQHNYMDCWKGLESHFKK